MNTRNRWLLCVCAAVSLGLVGAKTGEVRAQVYPHKVIRVVVPYTPGGTSDFVARAVGQKLAEAWGAPVNIDNRPGGGGNIGAELVARAPTDGYTLLVVGTAHAINPTLYGKLQYDPIKDFTVITQLTGGSVMLVVHPSLPAKTVKQFVALAKSRKPGIVYSSAGSGQPSHLGMEMLKSVAGFDAIHVPYKGSAPSVIDLMGGQVDASLTPVIGGLSLVRHGKLTAVAVTGLHRFPLAPEIPTIAESGYPGFEINSWFGLLAPAGIPPEIAAKLYAEVSRILKLPEVRERMIANGTDPVGSTPAEFTAYINSETIKWAGVVKRSGARAD